MVSRKEEPVKAPSSISRNFSCRFSCHKALNIIFILFHPTVCYVSEPEQISGRSEPTVLVALGLQ